MAESHEPQLPAAGSGQGPVQPQNGGYPNQAVPAQMATNPASWGPAYHAPPDEDAVPWARYLAALKRYKWLILLVTVLGTVGSAVATRFLAPEYEANATIWVETKPILAGALRPRELLESFAWQELLTTGTVLDSVVLKQRLFLSLKDPDQEPLLSDLLVGRRLRPGNYLLEVAGNKRYTLSDESGVTLEEGVVGDSIGTRVGLLWAPPASRFSGRTSVAFSVNTLRDVSNDIRGRMTSRIARDGNFLRITLTDTDPDRAAEILNGITDQFLSVAAEQKALQLSVQAATLEEQLSIARDRMSSAEQRLQEYRVETITMPREMTGAPMAAGLTITQSPVMQSFFNQKMLSDQLEQDIQAIRSTRDKIAAGTLRVDAYMVVPAVRNSTDLLRALSDLSAAESNVVALRQRYTDEHRMVVDEQNRIRVLKEEVIPPLVSGLIAQLEAQKATVDAQISTASTELREIPQRTIMEQRLEREKTSAENLFQMLQNNYEQTRLALQSAIPDVRPLDPAVAPSRPSSNSAPMIIGAGFLISFGLAIALAIVLDQLDKRFRYPDQVTDELGLTILGAVPAIKKIKRGGRDPEEASQIVEAFRTIRLGLAHSYGTAGPILLTVSSPGPGDGKSLVSSNLALSFAEAGYNTVLIDGDIRRGEVHRMFDIERQPGLLDYLIQDASLEQVVKTTQRGLTVIPCGTRRHLGPELLSSPQMGDLMAKVKNSHDVVIMDSPPLGAGIDPFVLATTTGNLLLVLRSGETDRQMAEEKLKLVDRLPIRVLGAVLNDVQTKDSAYRYYSYVYSYSPDDQAIAELPVAAGRD